MGQEFGVNANKSGVTDKAGKQAFPLHKIIATDKNSETKYGNNGLGGMGSMKTK